MLLWHKIIFYLVIQDINSIFVHYKSNIELNKMNTLSHKNYGAIYVNDAEDIEKVKGIIKEMDEFEYGYLPKDLIKPFSEYPDVCCTQKFSDLDMDDLTAICWSRGIMIWVFNARCEFPKSALVINT